MRSRKRDAHGRFVADTAADIGVVHRDYDDLTLTTNEVCIRNAISASTLHRLVRQYHWTPRAPHRIDPNDLVQRMLEMVEIQIADMETTMTQAGSAEATTLGKLVTTLDRLILIKNAQAKRPRTASKEVRDLRAKLADRIAELNH